MNKTHTRTLALSAALLIASGSATFGAITYIDAVEGSSGNTFATGSSLSDTSWVGPNSIDENNTQWNLRSVTQTASGTIFQGRAADNTLPQLTTQITGLADGSYDVWVFFWGSENDAWNIDAGLTSGSLTRYGSRDPSNDGIETAGVTLGSELDFDVAPIVADIPAVNLYGINIGEATVAGGSAIDVFIDSSLGGDAGVRTWYDGVGYAAVPEPAAFAPLVGLGCLGLVLLRRRRHN